MNVAHHIPCRCKQNPLATLYVAPDSLSMFQMSPIGQYVQKIKSVDE